jgi:hypothetical protein
MRLTVNEQIVRINTIDKNEKALILIKAIESSLNVGKVITTVINRHTSEKNCKRIHKKYRLRDP